MSTLSDSSHARRQLRAALDVSASRAGIATTGR